ncbi:HPF/RaiA family ribosome-associated protein [Halocola ammonii]
MEIQVNTDNNIEGTARLESYVTETVKKSLKHFDERLTRVEVHLSDENADKGGERDKKCVLEARPRGMDPIAVSSNDESMEKSLSHALDKLKAALKNALGKAGVR